MVRGLGKLSVLQTSPTPDTDFLDAGWLKSSKVDDSTKMQEVPDERGQMVDYLPLGQNAKISSILLQSTKDEFDLVRLSPGKLYAVRYSGLAIGVDAAGIYQYFCAEQCRLDPNLTLDFLPGERTVPFMAQTLNKTDEAGYNIPLYYLIQTNARIRSDNLRLWLSPRNGCNYLLAQLLDASGFANHGAVSSAYATIWQAPGTPTYSLLFDGVVDNVAIPDAVSLAMGATDDLMVDMWVKVVAADATFERFMSKKSTESGIDAGFNIERTTGNLMSGYIGDSSHAAVSITNAGGTTILQNVWKHVALIINRAAATAQWYVNGAASGAAISISTITGALTNTTPLYLGKVATGYGNFQAGDIRFYNFGAAGLPADIATQIANHFAAERTFYGV